MSNMTRETEVILRREQALKAATMAMELIASGDLDKAAKLLDEAVVINAQLVTDHERMKRDSAIYGDVGGELDHKIGSMAITVAQGAILIAAGDPVKAGVHLKEVLAELNPEALRAFEASLVKPEPVTETQTAPEPITPGVRVTEVEAEAEPRVPSEPVHRHIAHGEMIEDTVKAMAASALEESVSPLGESDKLDILTEALKDHRWAISSKSEADLSGFEDDGADLWWSNDDGWGFRETATLFTTEERFSSNLPMSHGGDAKWVLLSPDDVLAHAMPVDQDVKADLPKDPESGLPVIKQFDMNSLQVPAA